MMTNTSSREVQALATISNPTKFEMAITGPATRIGELMTSDNLQVLRTVATDDLHIFKEYGQYRIIPSLINPQRTPTVINTSQSTIYSSSSSDTITQVPNTTRPIRTRFAERKSYHTLAEHLRFAHNVDEPKVNVIQQAIDLKCIHFFKYCHNRMPTNISIPEKITKPDKAFRHYVSHLKKTTPLTRDIKKLCIVRTRTQQLIESCYLMDKTEHMHEFFKLKEYHGARRFFPNAPHPIDLTTQGIEPNPGPPVWVKKGTQKSQHPRIHETKNEIEIQRKFLSHLHKLDKTKKTQKTISEVELKLVSLKKQLREYQHEMKTPKLPQYHAGLSASEQLKQEISQEEKHNYSCPVFHDEPVEQPVITQVVQSAPISPMYQDLLTTTKDKDFILDDFGNKTIETNFKTYHLQFSDKTFRTVTIPSTLVNELKCYVVGKPLKTVAQRNDIYQYLIIQTRRLTKNVLLTSHQKLESLYAPYIALTLADEKGVHFSELFLSKPIEEVRDDEYEIYLPHNITKIHFEKPTETTQRGCKTFLYLLLAVSFLFLLPIVAAEEHFLTLETPHYGRTTNDSPTMMIFHYLFLFVMIHRLRQLLSGSEKMSRFISSIHWYTAQELQGIFQDFYWYDLLAYHHLIATNTIGMTVERVQRRFFYYVLMFRFLWLYLPVACCWCFIYEAVYFSTINENVGPFKDLTRYGIEPNPGPVRVLQSIVYTSPAVKLRKSARVLDVNPPKRTEDYCPFNVHHYGISVTGYEPTVAASNKINEYEALKARVLAQTPEPCKKYLPKAVKFWKKNLNEIVGRFKCTSTSFPDYIKNSNASVNVKQTLIKTKEQLNSLGIDEDTALTKEQLHRFTTRKAFVKVEKMNYQTPSGIKEKAPRLIQGATPEFICLVGPWMMSCQSRIKKKMHPANNPFVFSSGLNNKQTANHLESDWLHLEDDISKWDVSVSEEFCKFELWLVKQWGAPRAVVDLMRANINTHGYTQHGFKYSVKGTRKSGDPYTTLMNTLINIFCHVFIFAEQNGYDIKQTKLNLKMIAAGDDNALTHSGKRIDWKQGMLKLGFDSKAIYKNYEDLEFCSNRIYNTNIGFVFGPKPGKVIGNLAFYISPPNNVSQQSLIRGTALGLMTSCSFIPPLRSLLNHLLNLTEGYTSYQNPLEDWKMKYIKAESTIATQESMIRHYDWNSYCQERFDTELKDLQLGDSFQNLLPQYLVECDTSGPSHLNAEIKQNKHKLTWNEFPEVESPIALQSNKMSQQRPNGQTIKNQLAAELKIPTSHTMKSTHSNIKTQEHNNVERQTLRATTTSSKLSYEKDLTQYGIEPNPGPPQLRMALVSKKKRNKKKTTKIVSVVTKKQGPKRNIIESTLGTVARTAGHVVGSFAKGAFNTITGSGKYHINGGLLKDQTRPPSFKGSGQAPMVTHSEFISDVKGSIDFVSTPYRINPASFRSFPWLASLADNFEQYHMVSCIYEFRSTSADALNSTNTALGTVIGATQYDAARNSSPGELANFPNKIVMENYYQARSSRPSRSQLFPIECAKNLTPNYIRYCVDDDDFIYEPSTVGDRRFNDVGVFCFATSGMQASSVIGELWVHYRIELLKPRIDKPHPSYATPYLHCTYQTPVNQADPLAFLCTNEYAVVNSNVNLPATKITSTQKQFQFPTAKEDKLIICVELLLSEGTGFSATLGSPSLSGINCTVTAYSSIWRVVSGAGGSYSFIDTTYSGSTGSKLCYQFFFSITRTAAQISAGTCAVNWLHTAGTGTPTTPLGLDLKVYSVNPAVLPGPPFADSNFMKMKDIKKELNNMLSKINQEERKDCDFVDITHANYGT